nr:MAG TPA: hypothetical protein [Caudoviricetes sp.]
MLDMHTVSLYHLINLRVFGNVWIKWNLTYS